MMHLCALIVALTTMPVLAENVPEPDTYRGEPYKGAVPTTLQGAQVIDAACAITLHNDGGQSLSMSCRAPGNPKACRTTYCSVNRPMIPFLVRSGCGTLGMSSWLRLKRRACVMG